MSPQYSPHVASVIVTCLNSNPKRQRGIVESLKVMREHFGVPEAAVAREMRVQPQLLQTLLGRSDAGSSVNVVRLASPRSVA